MKIMITTVLIVTLVILFIFADPSLLLAVDNNTIEELQQRVSDLEKRTSEMATKQEHTDKHLSHMEGASPTTLGNISIAGDITMVGQGTAGNDDNDPPDEDVIDGNIRANLEIDAAMGRHGEAFLKIEAAAGDGLQDDEIVSFWGVNDTAGDTGSTLEMAEGWYEHRFISETLLFTVGKLDLTNYFDLNEVANDETVQFLAPGFVNSIAVEFPDNTLGSRLTWEISELLGLSVGWQDGDGDNEDIFEDGFYIAQAAIRPVFGKLKGNYRGYIWTNTAPHTEIADPADDDTAGWGIGTSIDQQVSDRVAMFGRLGYQDGMVYAYDIAWSAGVALSGGFWGRGSDVLGAAYGAAMLSDDYEDALEAAGIDPADERHIEVYYNYTINEHVALSPDIQAVYNALGDDDFETVLVVGLRGEFVF